MTVPTVPMEKVLSRIMGKIQNYPKGSLSRREIVCTIPPGDDPEATFAAADKRVTQAIYQTALATSKRFSGKPYRVVPQEELDALTDTVRTASAAAWTKG